MLVLSMTTSDKPSSTTSSRSGESRDQLLRAAKKVFAAQGMDGATVKEIAEAAGMNISLVSYHFGGKEGLFRACLEEFGRDRLNAAERILRTPDSQEEFKIRIRMFLEEIMEMHFREPDVASIIHRECTGTNPAIHDIFKSVFVKIFETLVTFVQEAQTRGILRPDLDPVIGASIAFSGTIHMLRTDAMSREHFNRTLSDRVFREHYLNQVIQTLTEGSFPRGSV